jgi:hypothetical protein
MKKNLLNLMTINKKNFCTHLMPSVHGHKTSIKFLGKRSSHHEKIFSAPKHHKIYFTHESLSVSPTSTLNMRPAFTNEEISQINTGGPAIIPNWTKIRVKKS